MLIGDATCSMERYAKYPNVHWLDFRPYEQIPGYGSGFDVALMPWLDNDWIKHANPIKMKEYLALGLAVVSTDFPEVDRYADVDPDRQGRGRLRRPDPPHAQGRRPQDPGRAPRLRAVRLVGFPCP